MTTIYHVEDHEEMADLWRDEIQGEVGCIWRRYYSPYKAWLSGGNPDAIILDIGTMGLSRDRAYYLNVVYQLRDKFPGAFIYLTSGVHSLPQDIKLGLEDDELVYAFTSSDFITEFIEHWSKYGIH